MFPTPGKGNFCCQRGGQQDPLVHSKQNHTRSSKAQFMGRAALILPPQSLEDKLRALDAFLGDYLQVGGWS